MIVLAVVAGVVIGSLLTVVVDRSVHIEVAPVGLAVTTAALFVSMVIRFDDLRAAIPAYWVLCATLVAQTWIDVRTQRLPREITYGGMVLGGVGLAIAAVVIDEPERIWMAALGGAIALLAMWLIFGLSAGTLGFGDVRLAPLLGMFLGWLNPALVLPGLLFGFVAGAVYGVTMLALRRVGPRTQVPLGPFLALGTIVAIFVGQQVLDLGLAR